MDRLLVRCSISDREVVVQDTCACARRGDRHHRCALVRKMNIEHFLKHLRERHGGRLPYVWNKRLGRLRQEETLRLRDPGVRPLS